MSKNDSLRVLLNLFTENNISLDDLRLYSYAWNDKIELEYQRYEFSGDEEKKKAHEQGLKRVFGPLKEIGEAPSIYLQGKIDVGLSGQDAPAPVVLNYFGAFECQVAKTEDVPLTDKEKGERKEFALNRLTAAKRELEKAEQTTTRPVNSYLCKPSA